MHDCGWRRAAYNRDFGYKILIAGNHDFYFEREADEQIEKIIPNGIIYLKDTGTTIEGLRIWGSPITPWYFNWAFNRHRGESIQRHWDLIPNQVDILITHGPVFRTFDTNKKREHVGCKDLFLKVQQVRPKVHICGHIHESYGMIDKTGIKFINACILNDKYEMVNSPMLEDRSTRKRTDFTVKHKAWKQPPNTMVE